VSAPTLPPRQWIDFDLPLPHGSTVEIDAHSGDLSCQIECANDPTALTLFADALRKVVVEVDEQRAGLRDPFEGPGTPIGRVAIDGLLPPSKKDPRRER
jgi:hypothetical protein